MLERARLAMRRLLTMSNLFENLADIYGDREVLALAEPLGYRLFPSPAMGCRDCLRFTTLAAEAFIRELDLKKGERVILCIPDPAELLLVSAALIKAGGIVVPVDHKLPAGEIKGRAQECGVTLAVADGRLLARRADLAQVMAGVERIAASGPRSRAPAGVLSLDEAMDASSGFFLPYTLKPGNVVGLFHTRLGGASPKAVMVTNEGLLGAHIRAATLLPTRPGKKCVHALGLDSVAGMCAAVLGLSMGLRMLIAPGPDPQGILDTVEAEKPAAFMAASGAFPSMIDAGASARDLSSVRFWFSAGEPLPGHIPLEFQRFSKTGRSSLNLPAAFIEAYGAGGNATVLALKATLNPLAWPQGCPGTIVPPNRAGIAGDRSGCGDEGELIIRGPAVTPGYWNDVEGTLAAKRGGWLYTGIPATIKRGVITLR